MELEFLFKARIVEFLYNAMEVQIGGTIDFALGL